MKLSCWNFYNFDLEAEGMPDILWPSQFFESLDPELKPIFEGLIKIEFAEKYVPEPTIRDYFKDQTEYKIEKITFSGTTNFFWVYHYAKIIEAYQLAKENFKKYQPPDASDMKAYNAVKKFFDAH